VPDVVVSATGFRVGCYRVPFGGAIWMPESSIWGATFGIHGGLVGCHYPWWGAILGAIMVPLCEGTTVAPFTVGA